MGLFCGGKDSVFLGFRDFLFLDKMTPFLLDKKGSKNQCRHQGPTAQAPPMSAVVRASNSDKVRQAQLNNLFSGTSPIPSPKHHGDGPKDNPQRNENHKTLVFGFIQEEHHADPAAYSSSKTYHPQQCLLRNAVALAFRLRLVPSIKDETPEMDEEAEKEN